MSFGTRARPGGIGCLIKQLSRVEGNGNQTEGTAFAACNFLNDCGEKPRIRQEDGCAFIKMALGGVQVQQFVCRFAPTMASARGTLMLSCFRQTSIASLTGKASLPSAERHMTF